MKKMFGIFLAITLLLTMVVPFTAAAAENEFGMANAEWGVQGSNGWYYYAFDGASYKEMDFDDESETRFFVKEDKDNLYQYSEIYENGAHPCADAAKSTVRGFKAPATGKVEITWTVAPKNASYYVFDGVGIVAMKNDTKIFPEAEGKEAVNDTGKPYPSGGDNDFIATPEVFKFTADVSIDDMLYFHLYNNGTPNYDQTKYDIVVKYIEMEKQPTEEESTTTDANNEAGSTTVDKAADTAVDNSPNDKAVETNNQDNNKAENDTAAETAPVSNEDDNKTEAENPKTSDPSSIISFLVLAGTAGTMIATRRKK